LKGNFSVVVPEIGCGGGPPSQDRPENPEVNFLFYPPDSRLKLTVMGVGEPIIISSLCQPYLETD
jgi:hypothetical protein